MRTVGRTVFNPSYPNALQLSRRTLSHQSSNSCRIRACSDQQLEDQSFAVGSRRALLTGTALPVVIALAACRPHPATAAVDSSLNAQVIIHVGKDKQFHTIAAAVDAAAPGSILLIDAGRYNEQQLVLQKSLTLQAAPEQPGVVELNLDTDQPYQHCLFIPADCSPDTAVAVQGLRFSHYSKSVANNYCIFAQGGKLQLQACDISSRSGVGVGVEGGSLLLQQCRIHDCQRHGVAVYGALEGGASSAAAVSGCSITGNRLNGVLVRDGGELQLTDSQLTGNSGYGVLLQDCLAELSGNIISSNRPGSVAVQLGSVEVDLEQLQAANQLDTAPELL